jgi:transcriptional regulator GlxA family with amidase domain
MTNQSQLDGSGPPAIEDVWTVALPDTAIGMALPQSDKVCAPDGARNDALRRATRYVNLFFSKRGPADPQLAAHAAEMLLGLVGIAVDPVNETPVDEGQRALRGRRLDAILRAIDEGFADPSFSLSTIAVKLRLSGRTIQDLLQSTGTGFADRVIELRLQESLTLLSGAGGGRRKVSDVAFASGFNDLSYFHRCFRRRFGVTPAMVRPN